MAFMISLIINADDLGINPERDRGIIEAFEHGVVTSSTMLANGSSFASASVQARAIGIPVGIHLNLSDGVTLSGPIEGLTDQDNRLPGKQRLRDYLLGNNHDLAGIRREFSAQIEKIIDTGLNPRHIDGHQHCHSYPALIETVIDMALEYGLDAMRTISPADPSESEVPEELVLEHVAVVGPALVARPDRVGDAARPVSPVAFEAAFRAVLRVRELLGGTQQHH